MDLRPERPDLRPERPDKRPERPNLRPKRPDLRPERSNLRRERPDLRPEGSEGGGNERTDGQMDKWTNGRTDERKSPCVLQEFVPFGAAAQKEPNL